MADKLLIGLSELMPAFGASAELSRQNAEDRGQLPEQLGRGGLIGVLRRYYNQPAEDAKEEESLEEYNARTQETPAVIKARRERAEEEATKTPAPKPRLPEKDVKTKKGDEKGDYRSVPTDDPDRPAVSEEFKAAVDRERARNDEYQRQARERLDALRVPENEQMSDERIRQAVQDYVSTLGLSDIQKIGVGLSAMIGYFGHHATEEKHDGQDVRLVYKEYSKEELDKVKEFKEKEAELRPECRRYIYFDKNHELQSLVICTTGEIYNEPTK